ncbi:MAG TPA: SDR family NAD(P)-dependent oxidoreductase [Bacteroidota bacterium]|nr:SDR family NAD(P)-dependent oxidoreductase [Bacteroidota bacterium]
MISLLGKTVLITGGSRGIGSAVAIMMAKAGATVALTYAKKKDEATKTAQRVARLGSECLTLRVNVTSEKEVRNAVATTLDHLGAIDILVNNAGIWKRGAIGSMSEQQWDETLDVNLKGTFLFCNAVVPHMKKHHAGRIINIASTAGQRGEPYYSHYAASKGGMIAFTKAIAAELAPSGINVNCVSPGWVYTDMTSHVLGGRARIKPINRAIPRGRVATPEEIAGSVVYLASDLADHVVGAVINVNGGSVLFG